MRTFLVRSYNQCAMGDTERHVLLRFYVMSLPLKHSLRSIHAMQTSRTVAHGMFGSHVLWNIYRL